MLYFIDKNGKVVSTHRQPNSLGNRKKQKPAKTNGSENLRVPNIDEVRIHCTTHALTFNVHVHTQCEVSEVVTQDEREHEVWSTINLVIL